MKIDELRIGNIVGHGALHTGIGRDNRDYYTVKELKETAMFFNESNTGEYYQDVKPIPLTEEWLLKFGFVLESGRFELEDIVFQPENGNYEVVLIADDPGCGHFLEFRYKYVHELQNLYFALKGKELEVR